MRDVVKLLMADLFELLAFGGKLFVDLDDFLRHHFVRFFRAAHQSEVRPGRDSFMAVGIKADPDHYRFAPGLFLFDVRHTQNLRTGWDKVKIRTQPENQNPNPAPQSGSLPCALRVIISADENKIHGPPGAIA
jgi:hypothetical protein